MPPQLMHHVVTIDHSPLGERLLPEMSRHRINMAWQAVPRQQKGLLLVAMEAVKCHTSSVCWHTVCMHRRRTWLHANEVPSAQGHKVVCTVLGTALSSWCSM